MAKKKAKKIKTSEVQGKKTTIKLDDAKPKGPKKPRGGGPMRHRLERREGSRGNVEHKQKQRGEWD